jgi:iron complex transport system ATP-binding protein
MDKLRLSVLNIDDLSFGYGKTEVLKDLDLHVPRGCFFSIIGPNGVGKSTLMKCLCGILRPNSGTVELNGSDLHALHRKYLSRSIAYVGQHLSVQLPVTVFDLVMMGRRPYQRFSISTGEREKVWTLLEDFGMSEYANRPLSELSGGKQQLVHIASALVQEPELLLLDEPTSNFDISHQLRVLAKLKKRIEIGGLTVVAAIHDLNLALRFSDAMLMLKDGEVFQCGDPDLVLTVENVRKLYEMESEIIRHNGLRQVIPMGDYS